MDTLIDYLVEARSAHLRNDWRASYTAFVGADGLGSMSTDDLEAYSAASWRAGHGSEATRLAERAFDRLVRTDQAAAAMKAAVLALQWHARRHDSVSRLWADRARGLLAGSPAGGTHGYLAYLDATTALEAGDTATAVRVSAVLRDAASTTDDATLAVLARVVDGMTALMESRVAEAIGFSMRRWCRCSTSASHWNGPVTCIGLCCVRDSRVDVAHRRAWVESMRRWVAVTGVAMDEAAYGSAL